MSYEYAIQTLRQRAFEIGARVLESEAEIKGLDNADDVTKLANNIMFSGFMAEAKEADMLAFLELLKAIRVLKNETSTNP